jgi:glycosyltransferase involved in cell wall biosynthesis
MKRSKILFVGAFPPPEQKIFGGIISSCQALLSSSFPERFDLVLLDSTQKSNPPPGFFIRLLYGLKRTLSFVKLLFLDRPDVVLVFPALGASLVEKGMMCWLAKGLNIPSIISPRGGALLEQVNNSWFQRFWIKLAFGGASKVLCQGPAWQRFAIEILEFKRQDAPIIFNWTASRELLDIGRKKLCQPHRGAVRLLFLGWVDEEKGIFDLIHVLSELALTHDFHLTIAGKGNAEVGAKKIVIESSLTTRVTFAGWVQGVDLHDLMASSDILILPSWAEGLPNAMVESMAAGLAVGVSTVGNIPDVIRDGKEGLLFPPRDRERLKMVITRLIDDFDLRLDLAKAGHQFAEENFSVEPAVLKIQQMVASLVVSE